MIFKKIYSIKDGEWTKWIETITEAVDDFYIVYKLFPNFLEANEHTFSQFDFLVDVMPNKRQCVVCEDNLTGSKWLLNEKDDVYLSSFHYRDIDVCFCFDNQLPDKKFMLVYNDEPEWDEPEIPINCPENELECVLV